MTGHALNEIPTPALLRQTLALARSEPVLQSDDYWTHIRALHFRSGRNVLDEAVGLCASPDPISRAVGADIFDASRSTRDRLVLTWSLERDWITLDVDLTRMHAAVASSAGRDPVWQSSLGKF